MVKMKFKYKEENTLEERQAEAFRIKRKYPERLPVIVEKLPRSQIQFLEKKKFLVPNDLSVAQFMWMLRKKIHLPSEKAIFLFVGRMLPQSRKEDIQKRVVIEFQQWSLIVLNQRCASMGEVYAEHKDEDGFLYVAYSGENTFGH